MTSRTENYLQRSLQRIGGERSILIGLSGAAFLRDMPIKTLKRLVDGGNYQRTGDLLERGFEWVWNVAVDAQGEKRDLRFWTREVIAPESVAGLGLTEVINSILPVKRSAFPTGEVLKIFQWQHQNISQIKANGQLPPGELTPRAALVEFLTKRWVSGKVPVPDKRN